MNGGNSAAGGEGQGSGPDFGGLFSMLGKLDSVDNEEDAKKLKSEMDSYLEKELGVDVSKLNEQIEQAHQKMGEMNKDTSDTNSPTEPDQD